MLQFIQYTQSIFLKTVLSPAEARKNCQISIDRLSGAILSNSPSRVGSSPTCLSCLNCSILPMSTESSSLRLGCLSLQLSTAASSVRSNWGQSSSQKMSSMRLCFTISSRMKVLQREGDELTQRRVQLSSQSTITSQPKSSNEFGSFGIQWLQQKSDLRMTSLVRYQMSSQLTPMASIFSRSCLRLSLQPPMGLELETLCLLMAKLVRWMKLFLISLMLRLNFQVLIRAKPSLQMKASMGLTLVSSTQIRMSNLNPSISSGFFMYFCTTMFYVQFSSAMLLISFIPRPRLLPIGFTIQMLRSDPSVNSSSWNLAENWLNSLGRANVTGRMLRFSPLIVLLKWSMFLQSRSFLTRFLLQGKWLTFWKMTSLLKSISGLLHVQSRFQEVLRLQPLGSSVQPRVRRKLVEMMSQTYYLVLTTLQYLQESGMSRRVPKTFSPKICCFFIRPWIGTCVCWATASSVDGSEQYTVDFNQKVGMGFGRQGLVQKQELC